MSDPKPLPPGRNGLPFIGETLTYLKDGFKFIEQRFKQHGPIFRTSLLGRKSVILVGPEGSGAFIDQENIERCLMHLMETS